MNRRGHLSHKIPNVKLRPPPKRSARGGSPLNALDDEILNSAWRDAEESNEAGPSGTNDKPWRGVVVTFTGVDEKPSLSRLVLELGGQVDNSLTIATTHVIAKKYESAKYHYAVEHLIPVLSPSWIHDAHDKWIKGEELDVPSSIELHRLQPFSGLKISVTGIDDLDKRKAIIQLVADNGGMYSKHLDRKCTHLVSAYPLDAPESKKSAKIKFVLDDLKDRNRKGVKYEEEPITIVHEAWLWDCIGYRGRWPESKYDVSRPLEMARVKPEEVLDGSIFGKLVRVPHTTTEEEEEEVPVVVKRKKGEGMESLVGELLSTTKQGAVDVDVKPVVEKVEDEEAQPEEEVRRRPGEFERKPSVLHASRSTAFTAQAGSSSRLNAEPVDASTVAATAVAEPSTQFFAGLSFSHAIAEGYQGLENALAQYGGRVVTEADRLAGVPVDYVIVRLASAVRPDMSEEDARSKLVTECWVESCCFQRKLLSPDDNLVFRPLNVPTPIPGAEPLLVHISGFPTEVTVYLRRLLKTIGGTLSEKLNRRTTHLVCAAPEGLKYRKGLEWGLIVVKESWLWAMGRSGQLEPVEEHLHPVGEGITNARTPSMATANLSTATDLSKSQGPEAMPTLAAEATSVPTSLPPSRMLKLTPTHINDHERRGETPLTPSKPETERLLNRATASPNRAASVPTTSERGTPEKRELKPAATMPAPGANDMTAALRRLAESDAGAPHRSKLTRRARPSSRPKIDATPSMLLSTTTSPTSPVRPDLPVPVPIEDESMRVTYADPRSEKEKKRLMDAVMRGGGSPAKRARV